MKRIQTALFGLLLVYSIVLIWMDLQAGQESVRPFFSEIVSGTDYSVPFALTLFGINTSLNVLLLTGCALLFAVCAEYSAMQSTDLKKSFFRISQVLFFVYLAADERLMIHEKAAAVLHVKDTILIFGLGLVELALLIYAGRIFSLARNVKRWLLPAAAAFAFMAGVDAFLPDAMPGRLALEDLSKTWASVFLLCFAWHYCLLCISQPDRDDAEGQRRT